MYNNWIKSTTVLCVWSYNAVSISDFIELNSRMVGKEIHNSTIYQILLKKGKGSQIF
jgi:hypothetical protein